MMRRYIFTCAALVFSTLSVSAQTILIDTFTNAAPAGPLSQTAPGIITRNDTDASAIGGNRRITNNYVSGTGGNPFTLSFTGTQMQSSAGSTVIGNFLTEYGFNSPLNLDASATNSFVFERNFLDLSANFTVTLVSDVTGTPITATFSGSIPGGGGPSSDISVPFASFAGIGSINLADIDRISFEFDASQAATQFTLDNLRFAVAVPEPTTIAMLGISGVAAAASIWYRRRKASRQLEAALRK